MESPPDPYDGPWKLGIDGFLPQLMRLLFPASHAAIDWSRSYQPLNTELEAIQKDGDGASRLFADALYQVWRRDGREQWIVLHLEVQTQPDADLARRMFVYAARCFEKYGKEVFGYAILGDRSLSFRPGPYGWELGNASLVYTYEIAKLIDFPLEELETSSNPAALMVLAHRYTAETKGEPERRRRFKLRLTRLLFGKGFAKEDARQLFDVLDWMMRLGPEQAIIFTQEARRLREEPEMDTYVNTFEWVFRHLGREEGTHEALERVLGAQLTRRFGELPAWVGEKLSGATSEVLERWSLQLLDARSLDEVFA